MKYCKRKGEYQIEYRSPIGHQARERICGVHHRELLESPSSISMGCAVESEPGDDYVAVEVDPADPFAD